MISVPKKKRGEAPTKRYVPGDDDIIGDRDGVMVLLSHRGCFLFGCGDNTGLMWDVRRWHGVTVLSTYRHQITLGMARRTAELLLNTTEERLAEGGMSMWDYARQGLTDKQKRFQFKRDKKLWQAVQEELRRALVAAGPRRSMPAVKEEDVAKRPDPRGTLLLAPDESQ